jgi:hypothetical protein
MTHKQEDIDAAKKYAKDWVAPKVIANIFLAGIEHKQKEVDEFLEVIEYAISLDKTHSIAYSLSPTIKSEFIRLIQKHAK